MNIRYCLKNLFACILFVAVFISPSFRSHATNYYISASGKDSNQGTTASRPWRTLDKVNEFSFKPGDSVFFKRGEEWRGTLKLMASGTKEMPIVYMPYGKGRNPVIVGSEKITSWKRHSGNIYKASVNNPVGQVFVDGKRIRAARFPDEGYIYVDSVLNETSFYSDDLDEGFDYTGTKWYGRTIYWHGVLRNVTASRSKTITLDSAPERDLGPNEGFFLMNKLEFLTRPGEWFYDEEKGMIYLWTPTGKSPSGYLVTGAVHSNGITIENSKHVVVEGFDIREQDENGILMFGSTDIVIRNNQITYPDRYGILAKEGSNCSITGNEISKANAGGMVLTINSSVIADNHIKETAFFDEIGLKGTTASNGGSGAEISGPNNIIEYNVIEDSNYNGLFYRGASVIRYNYFKNTCLFKDDGGAIYTNTSGSDGYIHNNIILNSVGNHEGYIGNRGLAEGIYVDRSAQNVIVENNTIINTTDAGIKLHEIGNIHVKQNTIYNARYGFFCHRFKGEPSVIHGNLVFLVSDADDYEPRQLFARLGTYSLSFNQNTYVIPFKSLPVFREDKYLTFPEWQQQVEQDLDSRYLELSLKKAESHQIFYNASKIEKAFHLNGASARNLNGEPVSGTFYLKPYTSIILVGEKLGQIVQAE